MEMTVNMIKLMNIKGYSGTLNSLQIVLIFINLFEISPEIVFRLRGKIST